MPKIGLDSLWRLGILIYSRLLFAMQIFVFAVRLCLKINFRHIAHQSRQSSIVTTSMQSALGCCRRSSLSQFGEYEVNDPAKQTVEQLCLKINFRVQSFLITKDCDSNNRRPKTTLPHRHRLNDLGSEYKKKEKSLWTSLLSTLWCPIFERVFAWLIPPLVIERYCPRPE